MSFPAPPSKKIENKTTKGMAKATLLVKNKSQEICPVDTGNLINSAFTDVELKGSKVVGTIGYTAAYAPFVHEMTDAKFKKPKAKAKFLEDPLKENTQEILKILKDNIKIKKIRRHYGKNVDF